MSALTDFTTYLAEAYGCRGALDSVPRRAGGGRPPEPPALFTRRIDAGQGEAVIGRRLAEVRRDIEASPAGILLFEGDGRLAGAPAPELRRVLAAAGLHPAFIGDAPAPLAGRLAVLDRSGVSPPPDRPAPQGFRVLAIVPARNEEDVICQTLRDLVGQGLEAYLVDNWSTDRTWERASALLGRGLVGIERFPPGGPAATYDLAAILARVEEIAAEQRWASWVVLHDADERRRSPWPGVRLREALWHVDRCGFSCVDHVTLEFRPVDDTFSAEGADLERHFACFAFSDHPGHFHQRRAWKQIGQRVALARSAGHDVAFPGRRVYPYKFLLKHYPIRSATHGERKLADRRARWNAEERARGWHRQYDEVEGRGFVGDPAALQRFDPTTFWEAHLVERLSGVGIFTRPPPWATPPRW